MNILINYAIDINAAILRYYNIINIYAYTLFAISNIIELKILFLYFQNYVKYSLNAFYWTYYLNHLYVNLINIITLNNLSI